MISRFYHDSTCKLQEAVNEGNLANRKGGVFMKSPSAEIVFCGLVLSSSVFAEEPHTNPMELSNSKNFPGWLVLSGHFH